MTMKTVNYGNHSMVHSYENGTHCHETVYQSVAAGGSTSESPAVISRIAAGRTQYGCTLSRLIQATMKVFWIIA